MKWITRNLLGGARASCGWLIKKFIDPNPEFIFVPWDKVKEVAEKEGGTPFETENVELSHRYPEKSTMDAFIEKYDLKDPVLLKLSKIFHGAPEGRGVFVAIQGISFTSNNDNEAMEKGYLVFDALYTHYKLKFLQEQYKPELEKMGSGAKAWPQKRKFLITKLAEKPK